MRVQTLLGYQRLRYELHPQPPGYRRYRIIRSTAGCRTATCACHLKASDWDDDFTS